MSGISDGSRADDWPCEKLLKRAVLEPQEKKSMSEDEHKDPAASEEDHETPAIELGSQDLEQSAIEVQVDAPLGGVNSGPDQKNAAALHSDETVESSKHNSSGSPAKKTPPIGVLLVTCLFILIASSGFIIFSLVSSESQDAPLSITPFLAILALITFALIFQIWAAFKWRESLIKSGSVALVPERWGRLIHSLQIEQARTAKVHEEESRLIFQNNEAVSGLVETVMTFKAAIEERDEEIKKLKAGYDYGILKAYFAKLIRLNETLVEVSGERPDDRDVEFLSRSMTAILDDCNIGAVSPSIGSDVRDLGAIVDDNVKFEITSEPSQAHLVSEVLSLAYVYDPEGVRQIIKPAKVAVYKYESEEQSIK